MHFLMCWYLSVRPKFCLNRSVVLSVYGKLTKWIRQMIHFGEKWTLSIEFCPKSSVDGYGIGYFLSFIDPFEVSFVCQRNRLLFLSVRPVCRWTEWCRGCMFPLSCGHLQPISGLRDRQQLLKSVVLVRQSISFVPSETVGWQTVWRKYRFIPWNCPSFMIKGSTCKYADLSVFTCSSTYWWTDCTS